MRENETRSSRLAKSLRARMPDAEIILWSQLRRWRAHGTAFRRQHPIGPYIADFACIEARLVIELDGEQHGSAEHHAHDLARDSFLQTLGWRVVRISNDRIYRNLGEVLDMIGDLAPAKQPPPAR